MSSRLLSWVAAGTMLLASAILMPATAALAGPSASQVPRTAGPDCTGGAIASCVYISGSGNHIKQMKGWATSNQELPLGGLHVELEGPHGRIKSCSSFLLDGYTNGPNCVWSPNANETPGRYCATVWWWDPITKGYLNFGTPCITVN